jgi:hypothetical protein
MVRRSVERPVPARRLEPQAAKEPQAQAQERPERGGFQLHRGVASRVEIVPQGVPVQRLGPAEPKPLLPLRELAVSEKGSEPLKAEFRFLAERTRQEPDPDAPELAVEIVARARANSERMKSGGSLVPGLVKLPTKSPTRWVPRCAPAQQTWNPPIRHRLPRHDVRWPGLERSPRSQISPTSLLEQSPYLLRWSWNGSSFPAHPTRVRDRE